MQDNNMCEFYESPDKEKKMIFVNDITTKEYIMAVGYYVSNNQLDIFFFSKTDAKSLKNDYTNVPAFDNYKHTIVEAILIGSNDYAITEYIK